MNTKAFRDYLSLLRELSEVLKKLTLVEQEKTIAVSSDDLESLNHCMKQEQALSLSVRGFEQKQQSALKDLGLDGIALRDLIGHAPKELQAETAAVTQLVQQEYALFRGAFDAARDMLESNLHQVEKALAEMDRQQNPGPGYESAEPELPQNMRTDFRA